MLTEELGAEPIWVLNNGLSHQESVPTARIAPLVADALDSIEFITGPADSPWGALRACMGHPEPWSLTYIGVGNEVGTPSSHTPTTHPISLAASCEWAGKLWLSHIACGLCTTFCVPPRDTSHIAGVAEQAVGNTIHVVDEAIDRSMILRATRVAWSWQVLMGAGGNGVWVWVLKREWGRCGRTVASRIMYPTTWPSSMPSSSATRTCSSSLTATWATMHPPRCGTGALSSVTCLSCKLAFLCNFRSSLPWGDGVWPFLACSSRSWSAEIRCLRVTELWLSVCRHWYTDPQSMFNGRYTFDTMTVAKDSYVFASEYAVFDWGISTIPRGNIQVRSPLPCHFIMPCSSHDPMFSLGTVSLFRSNVVI